MFRTLTRSVVALMLVTGAFGCEGAVPEEDVPSEKATALTSPSQRANPSPNPSAMCWTMIIGVGMPGGTRLSMEASSGGPPVETPTRTRAKRPANPGTIDASFGDGRIAGSDQSSH